MKTPLQSSGRNPATSQQARDDQVSALYELGLIPNPDKDPRKGKGKEIPSGSGLHPKKSELHFPLPIPPTKLKTLLIISCLPLPAASTTTIPRSRFHEPYPKSSLKRRVESGEHLKGDLRQRAGGQMAGMLDTDRSRTRRERTFVGSECAVCEEPLEHTLRGERILQFSCSHVSHEACFYEYIKEFESQYCPTCNAPLGLDTSRGGNVLDLGKNFADGLCSYITMLILGPM